MEVLNNDDIECVTAGRSIIFLQLSGRSVINTLMAKIKFHSLTRVFYLLFSYALILVKGPLRSVTRK